MIFSDDLSPDVIFSQLPGCACEGSCVNSVTCKCLHRSEGQNYFDDSKLLMQLQNFAECRTLKPVYECNSECGCNPSTCANRLVQHRLDQFCDLEIFDADNKGQGVRAARNFTAGDFVTIYMGLYITPETSAHVCAEQLQSREHIYVLVVREFASNNDRPVFVTAVDGTYGEDKDAPLPTPSLINHSCYPNLTVIPVRVDSLLPYLVFFARRDISAGEELTYDYGERSFVNTPRSAKRCFCGARNCRRFLPCHSDD